MAALLPPGFQPRLAISTSLATVSFRANGFDISFRFFDKADKGAAVF
jgi:hypothetical protein